MTQERDPAANQLVNYANGHKGSPPSSTTNAGNPFIDMENSLTITERGPVLLEDRGLLNMLNHFARERIPERVVHAVGAGAFGKFEVTHDITQYTAAVVFSAIGKKTDIVVRFSLVQGNMGSSDTARDARGFAIKFYTEDGNWDIPGINFPTFFVRDSKRFINFIHSQKRNPVTNIMHDWDMYWDFLSLSPETIHTVMFLYSDRGTPDGYRHMHGFGANTYKLVNKNGQAVYCKFHFVSNQGIKNLSSQKATELSGTDPNYSVRDLYNAIQRGDNPSWKFCIQVMTFEQAKVCKFNPFDVTKTWPKEDYPLIQAGKLTLDRNCSNYFAEIEQLCFDPANMIPGIEPSPDKVLQGRIMNYNDTQFHRIGVNFGQLPVNSPHKVYNYERDGVMTIDNQGGAPNYYPNSFNGPTASDPRARQLFSTSRYSGDVEYFKSENDDNYSQPRLLWRKVLTTNEKTRLVNNIVGTLMNANKAIQNRMVQIFNEVDEEFGRSVQIKLQLSDKPHANI